MATLTSPSNLFLVMILLVASVSIEASAAVGGRKQLVGSWEPIKDPKDKYILEIGEFAVEKYNALKKIHLEFDTVLKGDQQVIAGMKYKLQITAIDVTDGGMHHEYEAVVYDKPLDKTRELISFKQVG